MVPTRVLWERDAPWLAQRRQADLLRSPATHGCCPAAAVIDSDHRGSRCCTEKLDMIEPLRAVGVDAEASLLALGQRTVLFAGDSMAGQAFMSLLCLAWATPGLSFADLVRQPWVSADSMDGKSKSAAKGTVGNGTKWSAQLLPAGTKLEWVRLFGTPDSQNEFLDPQVRRMHPEGSKSSLIVPSILDAWRPTLEHAHIVVISGWMHGIPAQHTVRALLARFGNVSRPSGAKTLLLEGLPG